MPQDHRNRTRAIPRRSFLISGLSGLLAMLRTPSHARTADDPPDDEPEGPLTPEELKELRTKILKAHNAIRAEAGLRKLYVSRKLTAAAQAHAEDMAAHRKMTHDGSDGSTPADRVKSKHYRYFRTGENVAMGRFTIDRLMKGWMESPVHKKNILGGFSEIGVGCAVDENGKRYWCVSFGLPSKR